MSNRRFPAVLVTVTVGLLLALTTSAWADINPVFKAAVSRRIQAGANYDVQLPLSGSSGVECRRVNGNLQIVFFFDQTVTGATASLSTGTGTVNPTPTVAGSALSVALSGVTDSQEIAVTLSGITSSAGGTLDTATVKCRVMEGDTTGNGQVSAADVAQVKSQVGQTFSGFNFRQDLNMNGGITAADVSIVKAKVSSKILAGGVAPNTAPTITPIPATTTRTGAATVSFTIGDNETDVNSLALRAVSDNVTLLPPGTSYAFQGSGATRTVTITGAAGKTGTANVTVYVGDGMMSGAASFVLTVESTAQLYLANLYPPAGVQTQGWGTAWLRLDGDETAATVNVDYSNLNGPITGLEVRNSTGTPLVNLKTLAPQGDGSYRWTFPAASAAEIAGAIKNNQTYFAITTSTSGTEVQGWLNFATGSSTFIPPDPVSPVATGPGTPEEAARFLTQATYGPTSAEITSLRTVGYTKWLTDQFDPTVTPPTVSYPLIYQRCTTSSAAGDSLTCDRVNESWSRHAIIAPDQLRQRVAFALSQIFVVSWFDDNIANQPAGLSTYYDMLINDAFGNYRKLLEDVTLHPIMGQYLTMRGNVKPKAPNYTAPNENYAREILQLFSIGLNKLNPDGTLALDAQGEPIPTYDQNVIQGFAHVFTGWNTDSTSVDIPTSQPATQPIVVKSFYNKPMVVNASNHSTNSKLLLNGMVIPATASQTVDTANAELKQALDNIFNHPNVGPFISKQLIQRLVCSNPSPAYVYRVASIFNDDGAGVRGNLKAVVQAILLDPEARNISWTGTPGYGHLREPVLRMTNVIRAFNPKTTSGYWKVTRTDPEFGQAIFRATTVFNFFEPAYMPPGTLTSAGLLGPEFQITSETTAITTINHFWNSINGAAGWKGSDVQCTFANETALAARLNTGTDLTTGTDDLVDYLNLMLMSGQMPTAMRTRIITAVNKMTVLNGDYTPRVKMAIYLVATSPHCACER